MCLPIHIFAILRCCELMLNVLHCLLHSHVNLTPGDLNGLVVNVCPCMFHQFLLVLFSWALHQCAAICIPYVFDGDIGQTLHSPFDLTEGVVNHIAHSHPKLFGRLICNLLQSSLLQKFGKFPQEQIPGFGHPFVLHQLCLCQQTRPKISDILQRHPPPLDVDVYLHP